MDSPADRRLQAIQNHLSSTAAGDQSSFLRTNQTAGEFFSGTPSLSLYIYVYVDLCVYFFFFLYMLNFEVEIMWIC